jgi:hypothetical protein
MKLAIQKIQELVDAEKDEDLKGDLRRALDYLSRADFATDRDERPDYRDPNFKQVANMPEGGENEGAKRNRLEGELPKHVKPDPAQKTPPPVET